MVKKFKVDEKELYYRTYGKLVALFSFGVLFFMGFLEGFNGSVLFSLEVINVLGLIFLVGCSVYFYFKGKHDKLENKVDGIVWALVLAGFYLFSGSFWFVALVSGLLQYFIGVLKG